MNVLPVIFKPDRKECLIQNKEQLELTLLYMQYIATNPSIAQEAFGYTYGLKKLLYKSKFLTLQSKLAYSRNWIEEKGFCINREKYYFADKKKEFKDLDDILLYGMQLMGNELIYQEERLIEQKDWCKIYDNLLNSNKEWIKEILFLLTSSESKILLYKNCLNEEQIRFFKIIIRHLYSQDYPNLLSHKARKSILHIPEKNEIEKCMSVLFGQVINHRI